MWKLPEKTVLLNVLNDTMIVVPMVCFWAFFVKHIHMYLFLEDHHWIIKNKDKGEKVKLTTFDWGPGLGYRF